jgi:hypothetical protein
MDEYMIKAQASEDFNKARSKEFLSRLLGFLFPKNKELLSFPGDQIPGGSQGREIQRACKWSPLRK